MFKLLKNIKVYRSGAWRDTNLLIAGPSIALLDDALTLSIPGLEVIDGQGMYALPGYVDRHVHITGGGGEGGFSNAVAPLRVEALVRAGVTTVGGLLGTDGTVRSVVVGSMDGATVSITDLVKGAVQSMFKSVYGTLPPVKIANGIWEFLKKLTDGFQATDPADAALSSNADWWALIQLIILVWAIFKIFFSNLKRGGILLVQICVGSMHMLALARGYTDGFGSWCKQVAALCFTAFVQNLLYLLAIIMMQDAASSSLYFSLGLLLVAAEVPRIAQMFGLDTSARFSLGNAAHNVSSVVSLVKQFV